MSAQRLGHGLATMPYINWRSNRGKEQWVCMVWSIDLCNDNTVWCIGMPAKRYNHDGVVLFCVPLSTMCKHSHVYTHFS
jgi:hypothetical protein